jgi:hypothetical protein
VLEKTVNKCKPFVGYHDPDSCVDLKKVSCPRCLGLRWVAELYSDAFAYDVTCRAVCPRCLGEGRILPEMDKAGVKP